MRKVAKRRGFSPAFVKANIAKMYEDDLFNIFANVIKIDNAPDNVPERWILERLICDGQVFVYDNEWLQIAGNSGYFVYGEPTRLLLRTPNNLSTFYVPREAGVWVGANALRTPIDGFLRMQAAKLAELEISLMQNIIASRSGDIIGVEDEDTRYSIMEAILQKDAGVPAIVVKKGLITGENLAQIRLAVSFDGDRINQLKQEVLRETLEHYGIISPNMNKRERTQVGEFEVQAAYAFDSVFTLIDSANRDLERGGISTRFRYDGAASEFIQGQEMPQNTGTAPGEE